MLLVGSQPGLKFIEDGDGFGLAFFFAFFVITTTETSRSGRGKSEVFTLSSIRELNRIPNASSSERFEGKKSPERNTPGFEMFFTSQRG